MAAVSSTDITQNHIPFTERSSPATKNIDVASPAEMIRMLHKCEEQIFKGGEDFLGIPNDHGIIDKLCALSAVADDIFLNPKDSAVILSGCGTSGRLAFMLTRSFNHKLESLGVTPCFQYLIAGGDTALFRSVEATEDDPIEGKNALRELAANYEHVLYVGITCGLSAPYVAGQLDECLEHLDKFTPVALGFNPIELARSTKIDNWDKTVKDVLLRMDAQLPGSAFVINPIIGPEPVTGSSRMKGGTATKMLLEAVFTLTLFKAFVNNNIDVRSGLLTVMGSYHQTQGKTYKNATNLASAIRLAQHSLCNDGHIYYVADSMAGIVGIVDASECVPTFGANADDIQAFVPDGYEAMGANNDADPWLTPNVSNEYFMQYIFPTVTANDTVILLQELSYCDVTAAVLQSPASVILVSFTTGDKAQPFDVTTRVNTRIAKVNLCLKDVLALPCNSIEKELISFCEPFLREIFYKFVCNAITTCSHILKGKVFGNFMIDVRVSNTKLFHRAVDIISRFSGCDATTSQKYLLSAIYSSDHIPEDMCNAKVTDHLKAAVDRDMIVPTAIVMAKQGTGVSEAQALLANEPRVRKALQTVLMHGQGAPSSAAHANRRRSSVAEYYPGRYSSVAQVPEPRRRSSVAQLSNTGTHKSIAYLKNTQRRSSVVPACYTGTHSIVTQARGPTPLSEKEVTHQAKDDEPEVSITSL